jgi:hypothetical protein
LGAAIAAKGHPVEVDRNRLTISLAEGRNDTDELLALVRDEVAANDWGIRRLEPQVVTLEDVFLAVGT